MNYQSYPTVKTEPNRKIRKALRSKVFLENKHLANKVRKDRKEKETINE